MRTKTGLGAAIFAVVALTGMVQAADAPSGKTVAKKLCVNCHIVESGGDQGQVTAGIPSFMVIANKAEQTETKLRNFILNPHPPMPDTQLTTNELNNVVAYILSLRDPD